MAHILKSLSLILRVPLMLLSSLALSRNIRRCGLILLFLIMIMPRVCVALNYDNTDIIWISEDPYIKIVKVPDAAIAKLKTFTILISPDPKIRNIDNYMIERQIFSMVKNALEELGYLYRKDVNSPDFVVMIDLKQEVKDFYVPEELVLIPRIVPGLNMINIFNYNDKFSNWSLGTIEIPDYWTTTDYTLPGFHYYTEIVVQILNNMNEITGNKRGEILLVGFEAKHSGYSDVKSTYQDLLTKVFAKFPHGHLYKDYSPEWNFLGMVVLMMTMVLVYILV